MKNKLNPLLGRSMSQRIIVCLAILVSGLLVLFNIYFIHAQRKLILKHTIQAGSSLVELLATNARLGVFTENPDYLSLPVEAALKQEDIISIEIFTKEESLLFAQKPSTKFIIPQSDLTLPALAGLREKIDRTRSTQEQQFPDYFLFAAPVFSNTSGEGNIFDLESVETLRPKTTLIGYTFLAVDKKSFSRGVISIIRDSIIFGLFFLLLAIVIIAKLVQELTKPFLGLFNKVRSGALQAELANIEVRDDISLMDSAFSTLFQKLEDAIETINQHKLNLKHEVEIKTEKLQDSVAQLKKRESELAEMNQDLSDTLNKLRETQSQLIQAEKMNALGQLIAGVAHEINNATNFITGALPPLKTFIGDLETVYGLYAELPAKTGKDELEAGLAKIEKLKKRIDFDDIMGDIKTLVNNISVGASRSKDIVKNLSTFSRIERCEFKPADVHEGIDATLAILYHEYKERIKIEKEYAADLPQDGDLPAQINQVFMNILLNAIQAMPKKGKIRIKTWEQANELHVLIKDNGPGIPPDIQAKVFDPFFSTKPVGEGTGLGLSVSFGIVEQAKGRILLRSTPGKGCEFEIIVPYMHREVEAKN